MKPVLEQLQAAGDGDARLDDDALTRVVGGEGAPEDVELRLPFARRRPGGRRRPPTAAAARAAST